MPGSIVPHSGQRFVAVKPVPQSIVAPDQLQRLQGEFTSGNLPADAVVLSIVFDLCALRIGVGLGITPLNALGMPERRANHAPYVGLVALHDMGVVPTDLFAPIDMVYADAIEIWDGAWDIALEAAGHIMPLDGTAAAILLMTQSWNENEVCDRQALVTRLIQRMQSSGMIKTANWLAKCARGTGLFLEDAYNVDLG